MQVYEELIDAIPQQRVIVAYERSQNDSLERVCRRLKTWYSTYSHPPIVGRGGNHVFVSKPSGQRVLLITEDEPE